jgi:Zn-dependent M16 (insulinase) family peptidase
VTENKNYKLIRSKEIREIHSTAHQFEHIKTGARVLYLQNDDTNKAFNIAFKTPPEDSTGCPHILEHSVLNGSQHFPAKNTFTELVKGSMKTFLNAFTGSDRTMYPFASTNDKDFLNLMEVYLDAVLYPNIYVNEDILKQEGWHYELFKPEDEIIYKGVVYNEMKGAFSSPESVLFRKIQQAQLPDTPYSYESGGDPEVIPELTWEKFKAFHKRYYHPSNSWIYLYGDMDIERVLTFMDEKFLSRFDKIEPPSDIPLQTPFTQMRTVEESYSIASNENPDGKYYLSLNFTCGHILDVKTVSAMSALTDILMDSAASPLKLALQNSGLCADSFAALDDSCQQPTLIIVCKHVKKENIPVLKDFIYEQLAKIAQTGIDKKLIEAIINSKEFAWREADMNRFPKGLYYSMTSSRSWLHGGDPLSYLEFEPILLELRKGLTEPLFEQLIEKYLLQNQHSSLVVLKPVQNLVAQRDEKARQILKAYKESLTPEQLTALVEDNLRLQAWQSEPDTAEDIAKIPFISIQDIRREADPLDLEVEKHGNITLLKHDVPTNGIVYLNTFFDLRHLPETDLPWVELLTELMGKLDTASYSFAELANEIDINTGGISAELSLFDDSRDLSRVQPKLCITGKCITAKTEKMIHLLTEYALNTTFDNVERIRQLVAEIKSGIQMNILSAGHLVATRRMLAQNSLAHKWQDAISGLDYFSFLNSLEKRLEQNPAEITDKLKSILKTIYVKEEMLVSITAQAEEIRQTWGLVPILLDKIATDKSPAVKHQFNPVHRNEGITAPVNIQYCAQGGNYSKLGYSYSGKMMVLTNILRNDFLMQELRVKGGAYGIMVNFSRYGYMSFCSYRDPNLTETLATYGKVADYLKDFQCSPRDFEKYIIGTVAELDMPLTPSRRGYTADVYFITGLTFADRQKLRDEVLATTLEDIRGYAGLVADVMKQKQYAVFGVENKIRENNNLFDEIIAAIPT